MNTLKKTTILLCILLLFITGCGKKRKSTIPLSVNVTKTVENVTVTKRILGLGDTKTHFGTERIIKKGYRPIHLSIENQSNTSYILDGKDISIPLVPAKHVASRCHRHTPRRVIIWTLFSLITYPPFIPFLIAAVVDGTRASLKNKALNRTITKESFDMDDQIIIQPHSSVDAVFFVSSHYYQNHFDVELHEKNGLGLLSFHL